MKQKSWYKYKYKKLKKNKKIESNLYMLTLLYIILSKFLYILSNSIDRVHIFILFVIEYSKKKIRVMMICLYFI